jgi:hypothetical protein
LQIAKRVPNRSSASRCISAKSLPGMPFTGRQSGRPDKGALGGYEVMSKLMRSMPRSTKFSRQ